MRLLYHPDFPKDVRKFEAEYGRVSTGLAARFRDEVDAALAAIKTTPEAAGHFVHADSRVVRAYRRRNLPDRTRTADRAQVLEDVTRLQSRRWLPA